MHTVSYFYSSIGPLIRNTLRRALLLLLFLVRGFSVCLLVGYILKEGEKGAAVLLLTANKYVIIAGILVALVVSLVGRDKHQEVFYYQEFIIW